MARSPSVQVFRNRPCDCPSRAPRRACRCTAPRSGPRQDRRIFSRTAPVDFHSPSSFGSLDTQLSPIEYPQSPESSYSITSHDYGSSVTGSTADLEDQRHTSPPYVATPAGSEVSSGYSQQYPYQSQYERFHPSHSWTWPPYGGDSQGCEMLHCHRCGTLLMSTVFAVSPIDQSTHVLAGIDHNPHNEEAVRLAHRPVEFVSTQGPSPTRHQQYPKIYEPWNTQSLRSHEITMLDSETSQPVLIETALSPTSSNEKSSRRNGPLSARARKNANIVRQLGACRRCVYMKETCDKGMPCNNCDGKKGRKWKAGCMRDRLDDLRDVLFPPPIAQRYDFNRTNRYIYNSGFCYLDRPAFRLKLETGSVSRPLEVTVKEIEALDASSSILQAFKIEETAGEAVNNTIRMLNPPVVLYMVDKEADVRKLRAQLRLWMDDIYDNRNSGDAEKRWPWPCFQTEAMNWEGEVVEAIQGYYRPDLPSHNILQRAQCLLFFGYILDHGFEISPDSRETLFANLENPPRVKDFGDLRISPDTVARFIKMIVCGYAYELAQSVLVSLQEILHGMAQGKETSTARTDMAFCLSFLLLVYLAQSQSRLVMLNAMSPSELGIDLNDEKTLHYIQEMENTLGSYLIHFHEFAVKRRKPAVQSTPLLDAEEQHAREHNLMGKMTDLFSKYSVYKLSIAKIKAEPSSAFTAPRTFDLEAPDIKRFDLFNTHRLCWKFVSAFLG